MTVVYLDALFLLNFLVNYLLLLSAAKLSGEVIRRGRLALGAGVGGVYAGAVFFPGMGFLLHPVCKLGCAVLMLLCAFGGSKRLVRVTLAFFGASAALGGAILAIELLGGQGLRFGGGVFYSVMDLRVILLSAAVCYGVMTLVFRGTARHTPARELRPAVLTLEGRHVALTALLDTGNTLVDPASNRPVMVAEGEKLAGLFPPRQGPCARELRDPVAAMQRLSALPGRSRCRLLPYRAVGVECGLLLAVQVDAARVGDEEYGSILVALSPTPVSDGGGYQALIGP